MEELATLQAAVSSVSTKNNLRIWARRSKMANLEFFPKKIFAWSFLFSKLFVFFTQTCVL